MWCYDNSMLAPDNKKKYCLTVLGSCKVQAHVLLRRRKMRMKSAAVLLCITHGQRLQHDNNGSRGTFSTHLTGKNSRWISVKLYADIHAPRGINPPGCSDPLTLSAELRADPGFPCFPSPSLHMRCSSHAVFTQFWFCSGLFHLHSSPWSQNFTSFTAMKRSWRRSYPNQLIQEKKLHSLDSHALFSGPNKLIVGVNTQAGPELAREPGPCLCESPNLGWLLITLNYWGCVLLRAKPFCLVSLAHYFSQVFLFAFQGRVHRHFIHPKAGVYIQINLEV